MKKARLVALLAMLLLFLSTQTAFAAVTLTMTTDIGTLTANSCCGVTVTGSGTNSLTLTADSLDIISAYLSDADNAPVHVPDPENPDAEETITSTISGDGTQDGGGSGTAPPPSIDPPPSLPPSGTNTPPSGGSTPPVTISPAVPCVPATTVPGALRTTDSVSVCPSSVITQLQCTRLVVNDSVVSSASTTTAVPFDYGTCVNSGGGGVGFFSFNGGGVLGASCPADYPVLKSYREIWVLVGGSGGAGSDAVCCKSDPIKVQATTIWQSPSSSGTCE